MERTHSSLLSLDMKMLYYRKKLSPALWETTLLSLFSFKWQSCYLVEPYHIVAIVQMLWNLCLHFRHLYQTLEVWVSCYVSV